MLTLLPRWVLPSRTVLPWIIGAVSLAGFVTAWMLAITFHDAFDVTADFGPDRFLIAYTAAGTVLAARRPARVGWLLLTLGLIVAARAVAGQYARHALAAAAHPGAAHPNAAAWAA